MDRFVQCKEPLTRCLPKIHSASARPATPRRPIVGSSRRRGDVERGWIHRPVSFSSLRLTATAGGRRTILPVVHLRIVVPSYQAEHALDLLDNTPSVCNLIYLERAARRPEGDVILCDVAREDASVVIADLRELDIDVEGSISIEEIDSQVSAAAAAAEGAARGPRGDAVVWEEVAARTSESTELNWNFVAFMSLAMLIAGVGIYLDQPILIVGAMVVGPDFGPIAGACVAIVNRQPAVARRSALALVVGFPAGMLVTYLATLGLQGIGEIPESINFDAQTFTRFISEPNFFSAYVAVLAGIVGVLSLTSAKSSALVGVLISVATIPSASYMAVAAAYADWSTAAGAQAQLAINIAAIFAGGLGTLYLQRLLYVRRRLRRLREKARAEAGLPIGSSRRARGAHESEPEAF